MIRPNRSALLVSVGAALVVVTGIAVAASSTGPGLGIADAIVLGAVEGITEFLPISSTGHLLVAGRVLSLDGDDASDAVDSFTIVVQAGSIAAVAVLYRERFADIVAGALGRDDAGRRLGLLILASFLPAAIAGSALGDTVKAALFSPGPVAAAWIVGGVAMMACSRTSWNGLAGQALQHLSTRQALTIGAAQTIALWPGVSRSLVTILAGIAVGLSLTAAVEYSFLLGAVTLTAAAAYELQANGDAIRDDLGATPVAIGMFVALVTAAASVRWLVGHLDDTMLHRFGLYRIVAGIAVAVLLLAGAW